VAGELVAAQNQHGDANQTSNAAVQRVIHAITGADPADGANDE